MVDEWVKAAPAAQGIDCLQKFLLFHANSREFIIEERFSFFLLLTKRCRRSHTGFQK